VYEGHTQIASDDSSGLGVHAPRGLRRAAILVLILAATSAWAADLPNTKEAPVPPPTPVFTWTGFYAGVNGGYGLDHVSFPYAVTLPSGSFVGGQSGLTERGPLFGGQVGYNYEVKNVPIIGHAVVGVEADSDWANINGVATLGTAQGIETFGTRIENFGSLRGRLGYNFDRLLLYVSGGVAYGTTENYYSVPGFSGSYTSTRLPLRFGAYGAGLEYGLTDNWSIKGEYMYTYIRAGWNAYAPDVGYMSRATFHIVRFGLNYKFDLFNSTPVVANY
jgi:outer membrane immunogenic protein